jgi:hypothetical protein
MVSDRGDRGLFTIWKRSFWIKILFSFPLSPANLISDYFDIKGCGANNEAMTHRSSLRQCRCGSNSQRESWTCGFFFLVLAATPFTLRTFSAQINWRFISRKAMFDPYRFLSNQSPIHFAGESGNGNMFRNGKQHVQNENRHRSPRSQTYANNCKNLNPPYFSLQLPLSNQKLCGM